MDETEEKIVSSQYRRIATDIAQRIVDGEFRVGDRILGRSLMSSEYGVSPETIRRAFRVLADMKVLEVKPQSGAQVLSVDSARRYLGSRGELEKNRNMNSRLLQLLRRQEALSKELGEVSGAIARRQETLLDARQQGFGIEEVKIERDCWVVGKSVGQLAFWQATGATIVAVRRGQGIIVSPGPFLELYAGDGLIYVVNQADMDRVFAFLAGD